MLDDVDTLDERGMLRWRHVNVYSAS